jgi:DNA-binding transcriptional ArsR family regulator
MSATEPESHSTSSESERVLTALAHPLRRRLLDLLTIDGAATVSTLATRTGQAVGNVSHHLRVLGAAALIEDAHELARDRRERWWRRAPVVSRWSTLDAGTDPVAVAVATAAETINLERQLELLRQWFRDREGYSAEWLQAAFSTDDWLRLRPEELAAFAEELNELVQRWAEKQRPGNDAAREPVFVFARGFPAKP